MRVSYGTRGVIGVINIASTVNLEPEYQAMVPHGVAVLTGRVPLPRATPEELAKLSLTAAEATRQLASAQPDVIVFACTSGSFINGRGYDVEVSRRLEEASGGIPVITTSTALLEALSALKVQKVAFASPYIPVVNERAVTYLEDNGFRVTARRGLGLDNDFDIGLQTAATVTRLARSVDSKDADAVVISCTNLRTADLLETLEEELGKPVVSANQASVWHALRTIGIRDHIPGFGTLLRK